MARNVAIAAVLGLGHIPFTAKAALAGPLAAHTDVLLGRDVAAAELRRAKGSWISVSWADLARTTLEPGPYQARLRVEGDAPDCAVRVPACAGRGKVLLDGREVASAAGPLILPIAPGSHEITIALDVSAYERRIACGEPPRVGPMANTVDGLGLLTFASPHANRGGGQAVVYVPPGHDARRPGPLLVGAHPWNGSVWTYAAYQ